MSSSMVTGRMSDQKKKAGALILEREGLNASQAINLMYDRLIEAGNTSFLEAGSESPARSVDRWKAASSFIDSLSRKRSSRFDTMNRAEIRMERLASRGLM